jgi:hypothetical protein
MDPNEIIKHLPDALSVAKVAAGSIPFTGIVKRMLGPAADEVAEMWRDRVRLYRYERQLKCVEKAERMAEEAGFTPQAVPPKILFPLLEGASFEDDESLHDMWAALLANAASSENLEKVRPGFLASLRQMAPDEAAILKCMLERTWSADGQSTFSIPNLSKLYGELGFFSAERPAGGDPRKQLKDNMRMGACLDSLEALQLIRSEGQYAERMYRVTTRGDQFISSCRPPKAKE